MDNDFTLLLPEALVSVLAVLVLTADFFTPSERKHWLGYASALGLLGILAFTLVFLWGRDTVLYDGVVRVDDYGLFFKGFFLVLGIIAVLSSVEYVRQRLYHAGEFYGILLFTVVAAMFLASSGELLTAYISLELLSFSLYALVAFDRYNERSNEAGTKYILLGALSSAFLLYGISQVYGHLGTTTFEGISEALAGMSSLSPGLFVGIVLIIAGLGFKVAAVPFHMWAPDVYEGAPTPVTAYLAVGSKAAAFALFIRLFAEAFIPAATEWRLIIVVLAAVTMVVGNLLAIAQTNIKRPSGIFEHRTRGIPADGHRGVDSGRLERGVGARPLASGSERNHAASRRLRRHEHGSLPGHQHCLNEFGRRDALTFRRAGPKSARTGDGYGRRAVLARGTAHLRRIHQQVLSLHGDRFTGPPVAGWAGNPDEPRLALLLPDGVTADVHRAGP